LTRLRLVAPDDTFLNLRVYEEAREWPHVEALLRRYQAIDICRTEFAPAELRGASWLEVRPDWHHGYPMPDDDGGYLRATYDLGQYCATCGAGTVQRAPFRMRAEPKWGRRSILQLNWVFDQYFVRPDLHEGVFAPLGVESLPVLHHR
jgi:hypothetical protein